MAKRKKEIRNVLGVIWFLLILGVFVLVNFINVSSIRNAMFVYLAINVLSLLIYQSQDNEENLKGFKIGFRPLVVNAVAGLIFGGAFFLAVQLIPGLQIGLPNLPQAISDNVRGLILYVFAPISETILMAAIIGVLITRMKRRNIFIFIALVAGFLAFLHLGAYINNFYDYPTYTQGFTAIAANIGAFISAFAFFFASGVFMFASKFSTLSLKALSLTFGFISHSLINFIIATLLSVVIV